MDQPGKVADPARGQLNRDFFVCCFRSRLRIWSRETASNSPHLEQGFFCFLSRVSVSLLILHTQGESGAYSRALFFGTPRDGSIVCTAVVFVEQKPFSIGDR